MYGIQKERVHENLQQWCDRFASFYKECQSGNVMRDFTYGIDMILKVNIENDPRHPDAPRSTGTMRKHWEVPMDYIKSHSGRRWDIYVENTATIGQQYRARTGTKLYSSGNYTFKGRKGLSFRQNTRYFKFYDKKRHFYVRHLRVLRQSVEVHYRDFIKFKRNNPLLPWSASVTKQIHSGLIQGLKL